MWYLNLDSSSGDGTHWVVWLKKGKDKFYFDSYGVQPPSELIGYQSHQYFTIANESNKTVSRSFMSLRIEAAYFGK